MTRRPDRRPVLGSGLTEARRQSGLGLAAAASAAGLDAQELADLEQDRRRPTPEQLALLSTAYGTDLRGLLPARRPVEVHASTGTLVIDGVRQRRVTHTDDGVHEAYVALLCAVRGARRGEELPLRASDLEALLAVVGDDPDRLAERLVELMRCSPDEAVLLRRVLLRHRALTAAAGAAVGVSLLAVVGVGASHDRAPASSPSTVVTVEQGAPLSGTTSSASVDPRTDEERAAAEAADPEPELEAGGGIPSEADPLDEAEAPVVHPADDGLRTSEVSDPLP